MLKILFFNILLIALSFNSFAQQLHARRPVVLFQDRSIAGGVHITIFKHRYFAAWQDKNAASVINVANLGSDRDTLSTQIGTIKTTDKSAISVQLCSTNQRLYLFWATEHNKLYYCSNTSDTGFNKSFINILNIPVALSAKKGFASTLLPNGLAIAGTNQKGMLVALLIKQDSLGKLNYTAALPLPNAQTNIAPSVTMITDDVLRCCWTDHKDHQLRYADLNIEKKTWSPIQKINGATSNKSPVVCRPFQNNQVFYFWETGKNVVKYSQGTGNQRSPAQSLNLGLSGLKNLSICPIDNDNFLMACSGDGKGFQLNYFSSFNPATWINDMFYPQKSNYRLGDIVIPGSHDAGMSVLNGVGGRRKRYVNKCNTLTQLLSIYDQLKAGIRMFDIRVGMYNGSLYTKHAPADCMEESRAGGWGESLDNILTTTKSFLDSNRHEFIILNFSHFCDRPLSVKQQAAQVTAALGENYLYDLKGSNLADARLNDVAGKVVLLFENVAFPELKVFSSSTTDQSEAAVNFRREYAKTDNIKILIEKEQAFFTRINKTKNVRPNDLIRLDWQLTERRSEAALVCNVFRVERYVPIVDGLVWLTNVLERNKSILNLAVHGNKNLIPQVNLWVSNQVINRENKPNILFVDAAGSWITDFCVELNQSPLYNH